MSNSSLLPPLSQVGSQHQVTRKLASGETLFIQDSETTGLFFLASGIIDLKRTESQGGSVMIHRARAGDTFAEASIFSDTYHCTATAARASVVIKCQRAAITALLNTDIKFAREMAARFASQIQQGRRRIELLSIRAANERVLAAIKDGLLVDDITTFSELIGIAPETAYRALAQLSQDGKILKTARGQYQISQ